MVPVFLTGGVLDCDLAHCRSVAVLCMLYKIRCIRCTHFVVLYRCCMCQCGLHVVLWSHIAILMLFLATEPHSTAGLLFPSQCLSGMILMTLCSMVWDSWVWQAGPMLFYWLSCSLPFVYSTVLLSLLSLYVFVLWGWGLRTERALIALSQPCIASLF